MASAPSRPTSPALEEEELESISSFGDISRSTPPHEDSESNGLHWRYSEDDEDLAPCLYKSCKFKIHPNDIFRHIDAFHKRQPDCKPVKRKPIASKPPLVFTDWDGLMMEPDVECLYCVERLPYECFEAHMLSTHPSANEFSDPYIAPSQIFDESRLSLLERAKRDLSRKQELRNAKLQEEAMAIHVSSSGESFRCDDDDLSGFCIIDIVRENSDSHTETDRDPSMAKMDFGDHLK